jgi:hypothetical protein
MYDHHVVRTVHSLGHLTGNVGDALHVADHAHVELVRVERKHIAVEHVLSPVSLGEVFRSRDECGGSRIPCSDREPECGGPGRPISDEPNPQLRRVSVEHVVDRGCGIARRPDVYCAHCFVLSPNETRISSSAARTSHKSACSTARPVRSVVLRFTPTRRNCSIALARSG